MDITGSELLAVWDDQSAWPLPLASDQEMQLRGGADGLAQLSVDDFVGEEVSPLDSDATKARKQRGLRVLEEINEVAIVAVPDIHIQPIDIPAKSPPLPCLPDPCSPPSSLSTCGSQGAGGG